MCDARARVVGIRLSVTHGRQFYCILMQAYLRADNGRSEICGAGQNRYVYAMSAAWQSSRGTLSALQQLPTRRAPSRKIFQAQFAPLDSRMLARARDNILEINL